jgi:CRISPR-associated protein Cmr3
MSTILELTPHDPLIARDGRPFGAGQGNRMRGLPWPLPSVVAGSFRTALVKSNPAWDFSWQQFKQEDLLNIEVAGVFPLHDKDLYLPAPNDCAWDEKTNQVHRVQPMPLIEGEGVDFPQGCDGLSPVRLSHKQAEDDFKAKPVPAWWPLSKLKQWLTSPEITYKPEWFADDFLNTAIQSTRDHVAIEADRGAAAESQIFSTANLNITHLPRFGVKLDDDKIPFTDRYAEMTLSARVTIPNSETSLKLDSRFNIWHPLGGERRLVHWQQAESKLWECPDTIRDALAKTKLIRMVLATPAIFKDGWKPGWLKNGLEGELSGIKLRLVGVSNGRWKAVSGWDLVKRGPKAIRRMVTAGSVYFFEVIEGNASQLAEKMWLQSVSDDPQEQRDGFGLAVWGTWNKKENQ